MTVRYYDYRWGKLVGGLTVLPYQFALGFTVRWGEFSGLRLYLGPLKFHLSYLQSSNRKVINHE
jgi:hypothetical protein